MKKVEKDFLNQIANSIDTNCSFENIKDEIHLDQFIVRSHMVLQKWLKLSIASFVFLIVLGVGFFAINVEAQKYQNAISFFAEHDLSTENLSRKDIKAVHKDIITNTFTYSKTGEVIHKTYVKHVSGYEIPLEEPNPEEIASLWDYLTKVMSTKENHLGIWYTHYSTYKSTLENSVKTYDKGVFEKHNNQKLLWKREFKNCVIRDYVFIDDFIIVYGYLENESQLKDAWIAAIKQNGDVMWQEILNQGLDHRETITQIIDNQDQTLAIISRVNFDSLGIRQLNYDGTVIKNNKTEIGNVGILNATRFQDGYLIQLGQYYQASNSRIVKVNKDANIEEAFTYQSSDSIIFITDMIEYQSKIYLSAYSVPKPKDGEMFSSRVEIASVLNYLIKNHKHEISSEELTPMVSKQYTALLLVCDNTGIPQEFYSLAGSLGGKLSYSETGQLLWDAERITSTFYSPMTSSFTIGGVSNVLQTAFNYDGVFLWQKDTGEVVQYRR